MRSSDIGIIIIQHDPVGVRLVVQENGGGGKLVLVGKQNDLLLHRVRLITLAATQPTLQFQVFIALVIKCKLYGRSRRAVGMKAVAVGGPEAAALIKIAGKHKERRGRRVLLQ